MILAEKKFVVLFSRILVFSLESPENYQFSRISLLCMPSSAYLETTKFFLQKFAHI